MKIRANWRELAIKSLMNNYGYDPLTASKIYNRAVKRITTMTDEWNAEFQAYASLVYDNNFIKFDIKSNRLYFRKTNEDVTTERFQKAETLNRLSNMASKYLEVNNILQDYLNGDISLQELNNKIEFFRRTNAEYLKEGS